MSPENSPRLKAQMRRMRAYDEGVYELDDDEGFRCPDCGWRGLSAPANFDAEDWDSEPICLCPECESGVDLQGDPEKYLDEFV